MQDGLLPLKQTVRHFLEPPLPLHVDVVGPIHHHFGDLGVLEQELDGSQPDDRIRNLVDALRQYTPWQDVPLLAEDGERLLSHPQAPLGSRHLPQSSSVDPAQQPLVEAATNLHERVGTHQDPSSSRSSSFAANRSTERPAFPRGGSRRPRSWAAGTLRSTGITATGERPKTRLTSSGEISRLVARLTTNEQRSSRPVASTTRLAARNDSTSSPSTITTTSARPSPNLTVSSIPRGMCNTTTSAADRTASRTGPMSLAVTRSTGWTSEGPNSTRNPSGCCQSKSSRWREVSSSPMGTASAMVLEDPSMGAPTAGPISAIPRSRSTRTQRRSRRAKPAARWVARKVAPAPPRGPWTATTRPSVSGSLTPGARTRAVARASSPRSAGQRKKPFAPAFRARRRVCTVSDVSTASNAVPFSCAEFASTGEATTASGSSCRTASDS